MAIEIVEVIGAAAWASALINGDWSGLTEPDARDLENWIARELTRDGLEVVDVARDESGEALEPSFTWAFALHTGCDAQGGECITYLATKY